MFDEVETKWRLGTLQMMRGTPGYERTLNRRWIGEALNVSNGSQDRHAGVQADTGQQ